MQRICKTEKVETEKLKLSCVAAKCDPHGPPRRSTQEMLGIRPSRWNFLLYAKSPHARRCVPRSLGWRTRRAQAAWVTQALDTHPPVTCQQLGPRGPGPRFHWPSCWAPAPPAPALPEGLTVLFTQVLGVQVRAGDGGSRAADPRRGHSRLSIRLLRPPELVTPLLPLRGGSQHPRCLGPLQLHSLRRPRPCGAPWGSGHPNPAGSPLLWKHLPWVVFGILWTTDTMEWPPLWVLGHKGAPRGIVIKGVVNV